jgi:hypothetical protein
VIGQILPRGTDVRGLLYCRWLVQQATHDGSLPSVRVGRRILIPRSRLLAWLDGQHENGAPGASRDTAHNGASVRTALAPRTPQAG